MPLYAFRLSLYHQTFRIPSLLSIAQVFDFPIKFIGETDKSILIIELEKEEHAQKILDRGTLVLWGIRLFAESTSYPSLHETLKTHQHLWQQDLHKSFRISVESVHHRISEERILETIKTFSWMDLKGKVKLKNPEVEYVIVEEYEYAGEHTHEESFRETRDLQFSRVYFGTRLGYSTARPLITAHSVKTRAYYGTTSMDAEMGFIMAGQALPAPGKIIYDPFVGTGSMLYASAHWGAYVWGSDIDGRQIRGKSKDQSKKPGILKSAEQYGLEDKIIDNLTFDITKGPWRRGGWVDAIITDPPYGVRAGAKRLGKRLERSPPREEPFQLPDGTYSHQSATYLPPCRPYELANLTLDLILLARYLLVPKGRLVFFLPTVTEDYEAVDIPLVNGMRELKIGEGSVQDFGKWGRRLITMEKTQEYDGPPPTFEDHEKFSKDAEEKLPGHFDFRNRYFEKFAPRSNGTAPISNVVDEPSS